MPTPAWNLSGHYWETCSCDFLCPCILTQMTAAPSKETCTFAMAFNVERGSYGSVPLEGVAFIILGRTPGAMGNGNWSVGVVVDEGASAEQRDAIGAIASGAAGGPMAALSGLVTSFLGMDAAPIAFNHSGVSWTVSAGTLVDMAAAGAMGIDPEATEPMHLTGTGHPANDSLALCRASRSHVAALGLTWDDASGHNSGAYTPFNWRV